MVRTPAALALLVLAQCARDVTVPTGEVVPAFLGPLSGFHTLSLQPPEHLVADGPVPEAVSYAPQIPLQSSMSMLHLENPTGGDDPVMAYFQHGPSSFGTNGADLEEFQPNVMFASGNEEGLAAFTDDGRTFGIRPLLGGRGMVMGNSLSVCPGGDAYTAYAERFCSFDGTLSGVYRAVSSDCGGADPQPFFLGLGFSDVFAVGMRYPETFHHLRGEIYRGLGGGFFVSYDVRDSESTALVGGFDLSESGGELRMHAQLFDANDNCVEQIEASRLSGGELQPCLSTPSAAPLLEVFWEYVALESELRVALVHRWDPSASLPPDSGAWTRLRRTDGTVIPAEVDAEEAGTARFLVTAGGVYELWAYFPGGEYGEGAGWAVPTCIGIP